MGRESYDDEVVKLAPLALAIAAVAACGDEPPAVVNPGGLVHSEAQGVRPIEVARAAKDVRELARALAMPHHQVTALLGSHAFSGESTIEVRENGAVVDALTVTTSIAMADGGEVAAKLTNSKDYGREVVFKDHILYLRGRYGDFLARPPQTDTEVATICDEIYGDAGAYFALLASGATASEKGTADHHGRKATRIAITTASEPRKIAASDLPQRAWREDAKIESVTGEVLLDDKTGAPLAAHVKGKVAFARDGHHFEMTITASGEITGIGESATITAPPPEHTAPPHASLRELAERKQLLRGIAPPPRRAPTPENPTGIARPEAVQ